MKILIVEDDGKFKTLNGLPTDIPKGAVLPFAMSAIPEGWLKCNGAAISRTVYNNLFSLIGTTYGAGDGSTTYNLPDLRGEFVRGWDDSRGVDTSRTLGTNQGSANLSHAHTITDPKHTHVVTLTSGAAGSSVGNNVSAGLSNNLSAVVNTMSSVATGITINNSGDTESRPRNVALMYCIKY